MRTTPLPSSLTPPREFVGGGWSRLFASASSRIATHWRAFASLSRRRPKALAVVETSPLGDRRFVSVIQFERQRFLIGSSPSSITLLSRLPNADPNVSEARRSEVDGERR